MWRLRVFVGSDHVTGNPLQVARIFRGTKKQADAARAEFVAQTLNGGAPLLPSTTLGEYLERWLDHITPTRSPTTVRGYRFKIKRILQNSATSGSTSSMPRHLDRTYREWLEEGLDPSTVHHLHRVLSAALGPAVRWGLLSAAVSGRATPPDRRYQPKAIPAPEVVQRLIATAEERVQPIFAAAIAIAATTGLRRGELAGLRWRTQPRSARPGWRPVATSTGSA